MFDFGSVDWESVVETIVKVFEGGTDVMGFLNKYLFSNVVPVAEVFKKVIEFLKDFFTGDTFGGIIDFFKGLFGG